MGVNIQLEDIVGQLPEPDQRALYLALAKKFRVRKNGKVPNEVKVVLTGKMLALMKDMNCSEMKTILKFALATVEMGIKSSPNPGRDEHKKVTADGGK